MTPRCGRGRQAETEMRNQDPLRELAWLGHHPDKVLKKIHIKICISRNFDANGSQKLADQYITDPEMLKVWRDRFAWSMLVAPMLPIRTDRRNYCNYRSSLGSLIDPSNTTKPQLSMNNWSDRQPHRWSFRLTQTCISCSLSENIMTKMQLRTNKKSDVGYHQGLKLGKQVTVL